MVNCQQPLISKHRGKASNNQPSSDTKKEAIRLIREQYLDFGPTLAHEKLVEKHDLVLSVESCRQLMIQEDIWKGKKRKAISLHQMRQRRSAYGELVQIDGSHHCWFEERGPKCTLLVFVDDATGKLMCLHFEKEETTQGYMDASKSYFLQHGKPIAFYSDRHSIFRVNIKEAERGTGETQLGRAFRELDIDLLHANSPQAKGRVERMNGILQDRLVKELRLKGINDMAKGNAYLPEFIEDYNNRFAIPALSEVDAHCRLMLDEKALDGILCQKHKRKISKNLEVQYGNKIYQIEANGPGYTMRGGAVEVRDNKGEISLIYKNKELIYKIFNNRQEVSVIVTSKQINDPTFRTTHAVNFNLW